MRIDQYLNRFPSKLRSVPALRRAWTREDPLLFCLVYLQHSIRFGDDEPSLSQFHLDLADYAKSWMHNESKRDAFIAPREAGKTQWLFKILPIWAAAHGHLKFIAAFSDSASQAQDHLETFTKELSRNVLLNKDYPDLCKPMMRGTANRFVSQSREQIQQANGFSFSAKGIDAKALGMKIGDQRPDLILLDDIEPTESNYSINEAQKRKRTVLDGIFYLGSRASIVLVGTTTMSGSLIDQIRQVGELRSEHAQALSAVHSAESDADQNVKHSASLNTTINATTDNRFYVLDKDYLRSGDERNALSEPLEANETSVSHSVADKVDTSSGSDKALQQSISQQHVSEDISTSLSSSTESANEPDIVTEERLLAGFATSQSDQVLTAELTSANGSEIDLKSENVKKGISTSNSHISNFEEVEQAELVRLNLVPAINDAETKLDAVEHLSETLALDNELQWVEDERIEVHYYPAIVLDDNGIEQSWWPESKSMDELNRQRHTRAFAMNMMNRPVNVDAEYWTEDDIELSEPADGYRFTLVSIDPAVSTKTSSDFTGIAVVSLGYDGLCYVRNAEQLRLVSTALLGHVNELIELFDAALVVVETNQGGDVWANNVFDGLKAKFHGVHQQEAKTIRAARALDYYRKDRVRHTRRFAALEDQMFSFPKVAHDDLVDAVGTGLSCLLESSGGMKIKKRAYR